MRRKLDVGQYVIERSEHFIAIKPFASRYEWEVHILPLQHQADYRMINADELTDLGRIIKRTMSRLEAVLGGVQYNYFIHSLPPHGAANGGQNSFHWHIEICPRTSIPTGFELGAGLSVNTISPEEAAIKLRDVTLGD